MDANGNSTGYPWSSGDVLLAADLNSAIANAGALSAGAYSKVFSVEAFGAKGDRKQYSGTLTCASGLNPTLTIAGADLSAVKPGQLVVLPLGGAAGAGVKATVASVVGSAIALVGSVATALSNIAFQATGTPTIATAGVGVSPLDVYTLVDGPFPALIPAQVMVVTTKVVTVTANTNGSGGIDGSYTFQGTSGAQTLFQFTATVASGALVPASIVLTRAGVYQKAPANIAAEPIVDVGGISGLVNATVKLVMGANGTAILGRSGSGPPVIDENGIELFGQPGSVATVVVPGGYSAIPPNPVSTTGPGTGVTLIVNWASPTVIIGTDNAPMINAALDAIRAQGTGSPRVTVNAKLVFSTASDYLVNDALNVTELSALMIDGQRAAIYSCANGLPVFDEMSSNDITNINLCIAGDPTFPPRWPFQYGYTRPGAPAPRMTFDQLLLTGSFSDAGFDYNFASESINMGLVQANIRAPYSRIMDACNSSYWNATSKYIPTTIARDAPVSFIGGTSGQISLINSHPAGSSVWMLGGTGHNYTDAYLYSHQEAFVINVSTLTVTAGLLADHCHIEGSRHAFYGQQAPGSGKPSWTFSRLSYSDSLSFVSEAIYALADNVLHTGFFNHTINVGFQSATAKYFDDPTRIVYSGTVIGSEGTAKRWTNNQPASMTGIVIVFGGVPPQTLIYNATGEDDTLLNGMLSVSGAVQTGSSLSVSNGAVASVHVNFGGFYTNPDFPTCVIDPPASGVTALASVTGMSWFAAKDAIVAAGTGYVVGDVFTLVGGTHAVAASASVVSVNGTGGVTGVAIVNPGIYSAYPPAGATTTTGGSGTGLVMGGSIWGVIARDTIGVTVTVPGSGYTSFPNVAFSAPLSGDPQARGTVLMGTAWYADSGGAHGTFTGTIGSGSTGAFLPLTGGTVTGATRFSGGLTASAIDSTPIGATTPSTGAFTNLSATGTVMLPAGTTGPFLPLTGGLHSIAESGAVGDGVTDDQPAIQAWLNTLTAGAEVLLQPGKWYYVHATSLTIPPHIVIRGAYNARDNQLSTAGTFTAAGGFYIDPTLPIGIIMSVSSALKCVKVYRAGMASGVNAATAAADYATWATEAVYRKTSAAVAISASPTVIPLTDTSGITVGMPVTGPGGYSPTGTAWAMFVTVTAISPGVSVTVSRGPIIAIASGAFLRFGNSLGVMVSRGCSGIVLDDVQIIGFRTGIQTHPGQFSITRGFGDCITNIECMDGGDYAVINDCEWLPLYGNPTPNVRPGDAVFVHDCGGPIFKGCFNFGWQTGWHVENSSPKFHACGAEVPTDANATTENWTIRGGSQTELYHCHAQAAAIGFHFDGASHFYATGCTSSGNLTTLATNVAHFLFENTGAGAMYGTVVSPFAFGGYPNKVPFKYGTGTINALAIHNPVIEDLATTPTAPFIQGNAPFTTTPTLAQGIVYQGARPNGGTSTILPYWNGIIVDSGLNPIPTFTINMPAYPADCQVTEIWFNVGVTAITFGTTDGSAVGNWSTAAPAGSRQRWIYSAAQNKWFPGGAGAFMPLSGGTVTGATTFSAAGTALTVTNNTSLGGPVVLAASAGNFMTVTGGVASTNAINIQQSGTGGFAFGAGTASISAGAATFAGTVASAGANILQAGNATGTNNVIRFTPTAAAGVPSIATIGVDTNVQLDIICQGTGGIRLRSPVGFNNTTPIAKPTVSGAKGSNAALASLMTALAAYGLVVDSTTA
jgi:hypothetical protein